MAQSQPLSFSGGCVVAQARMYRTVRGGRDRAAPRNGAHHIGWTEGAVLWAATTLGRRIAGLGVAGPGEALAKQKGPPDVGRPFPLVKMIGVVNPAPGEILLRMKCVARTRL